ncbi:hypothetical protein STSP2_01429 [Anaerohalosphaera lusitana]|uniref:Uncharacterized protein n=1 Tax=Anaerohalosphaera lusitana TaxID=1936003 RepID=A0A1U9NK17_9BACT|nr:hypothetical protein [Anaerohalosphaera lusitana]AQT68271.1 hypothetical protein STSP2_01429 [Anaerohalosphaera lusitana]
MSVKFLSGSKCVFMLFLAALSLFALPVSLSQAAEPAEEAPRVHAVVDIGHQFSFYGDGRFHTQYLPGQPRATCWGALYNFDYSNANLLVLLGCESKLKYLPKDFRTMVQFMRDGGGVVLLGWASSKPQNELAQKFGVTFKKGAKKPFKAVSDEITDEIEGRGDWFEIRNPAIWEVLIADAQGRAVLARRNVGKGTLLVGARGLAGSRPDAKDNINASWWTPLLEKTSAGKPVDPKKPFRSIGLGNLEYTEKLGNIKLHYSEYLRPYAKAMADIYQRVNPQIEERMGVPLSDGMASEIGLLATGGGGFSSGRMLGLAVFWGGFPDREDSMIEFITHESVHSWVLPFPEIWNEPIATYVGDLVMVDMGYPEEGMRRINRTIDRAKKIDPTMKKYDIRGKSITGEDLEGGQANAMHWGKTFWIFEQMRKENPDVVADYFKAKRELAKPGEIEKYDANNTVAIMSVAMGRDMFGWFHEHGFDVSRDKSEIKIELESAK